MSGAVAAVRPGSLSGAATAARRLDALEHELGVVVRRARRVICERARAVDPDLQSGGYLVLAFLADSGPRRGAEVVDCLGVDKGAISRQVQHLVDLGLVVRSPDPADGRAHLLTVTAEARRRLADVAAVRRTHLEGRLADWPAADLAAFVTMLARYNADLADG